MKTNDFDQIPRGNTAPFVNNTIIKSLISKKFDLNNHSALDIPCGEGIFLDVLKDYFPNCETIGADLIHPQNEKFNHRFVSFNASKSVLTFENQAKFKLITCISGVMEFDNTLHFLGQLRNNLDDQGILILTNDNLLTVRDRCLYLLFGRFGQYKLFIENGEPTWKIVSLQNILRIIDEAGLKLIEIKYVPVKWSVWLWLPLALILYFFQSIYLHFAETKVNIIEKKLRYPFLSLLSRHYILICSKKSET